MDGWAGGSVGAWEERGGRDLHGRGWAAGGYAVGGVYCFSIVTKSSSVTDAIALTQIHEGDGRRVGGLR